MDKDILRRVRFAPYRKGMGPRFTLTTWYTGRVDHLGKDRIGYSFRMREPGARKSVELFTGDEFCCSPMHAIDGDKCIAALMGFLTLRPGDTDDEYFANYTPEQKAYAENYAETLACEVYARFGED